MAQSVHCHVTKVKKRQRGKYVEVRAFEREGKFIQITINNIMREILCGNRNHFSG